VTHQQAPPYGIYPDLLAASGERVGQELGALGGLTQRVQNLEVEVGGLFVWGVSMRVVHAPIMALLRGSEEDLFTQPRRRGLLGSSPKQRSANFSPWNSRLAYKLAYLLKIMGHLADVVRLDPRLQ
jgi:hypothetical protein